MLRRRAFRGRVGGRREPTIWTRDNITNTGSNVLDVTTTNSIADPALLPAVVGTDQRYTVMKVILQLRAYLILTAPAATIVGDAWALHVGIFKGSAAETLSPVIGASTVDDWLWLGGDAIRAPVAGAQTISADLTDRLRSNLMNQLGRIDIKAKRKLDADEAIRIAWRVSATEMSGTGHNLTAATLSQVSTSSVLWKRTMR